MLFVKNMKTLSNKEKRELAKQLNIEINKKDKLTKKNNIYYLEDNHFLIEKENQIFPHLKDIENNPYYQEKNFSSVTIDKGAMPFILKGADLMRPGITKIENFDKNEIITIKEENHNKIIAIGQTLLNSEQMQKENKGKVIKILHYYNDEFFTK